MNKVNDENIDVKLTIKTQELMLIKAREIFQSLCKEIDPDKNTFDLNQLRGLLNTHRSILKKGVFDLLNGFHLHTNILNNQVVNGEYNIIISEEAFCNFITGKEIKKVLFDQTLENKRNNVEDFYTLWYIMGGNKEDLSKKALNNSLSKMLKIYTETEGFLNDNYIPEKEKNVFNDEAQQIIKLLSTSKDELSLVDFINAMTSEFLADFDDITIDDPAS